MNVDVYFQYICFFQVNISLPPPTNTAVPSESVYTRRPVQDSEHEERQRQVEQDKRVYFSVLDLQYS